MTNLYDTRVSPMRSVAECSQEADDNIEKVAQLLDREHQRFAFLPFIFMLSILFHTMLRDEHSKSAQLKDGLLLLCMFILFCFSLAAVDNVKDIDNHNSIKLYDAPGFYGTGANSIVYADIPGGGRNKDLQCDRVKAYHLESDQRKETSALAGVGLGIIVLLAVWDAILYSKTKRTPDGMPENSKYFFMARTFVVFVLCVITFAHTWSQKFIADGLTRATLFSTEPLNKFTENEDARSRASWQIFSAIPAMGMIMLLIYVSVSISQWHNPNTYGNMMAYM